MLHVIFEDKNNLSTLWFSQQLDVTETQLTDEKTSATVGSVQLTSKFENNINISVPKKERLQEIFCFDLPLPSITSSPQNF